MENVKLIIKYILEEAGLEMKDISKTTILLKNISNLLNGPEIIISMVFFRFSSPIGATDKATGIIIRATITSSFSKFKTLLKV